ncbi:hypothetical protein ACI48D_11265 [Massilia sp. LXY-6]|uniref:hypothetical protein n=1 Tax=Massilia sp. LXY-6 TaxID=3379823 RepID=UPI003EE3533B
MEIRKAYLRRSVERARLQQRVAVTIMLVGAACAAFLLQPQALRPDRDAAQAATRATPMPAAPERSRVGAQDAPAAARRVYPYSIVPGGVTDRMELARAVMADKVVAAHYAGFAVDKASLRSVAAARAVYVSYRKGERVYWTAHTVTLAEGESVLSDGRNDIRARCGNRISDTPQLPVEATGPDERELDTPLEQARNGGEGALRKVAFALGEQDEGRQFALPSFPNGAGLLAAAQPQAGPGQSRLDSLFDAERRQALLASLAGSPYQLGTRTTGSGGTKVGATGTPGATVAGGGGTDGPGGTDGTDGTDGTGSTGGIGGTGSTEGAPAKDAGNGGNGDTAPNATGGPGKPGTPASQGPGSKPGGDTGKPPAPDLRTGLPSGEIPAKPLDLPEPDGLWLSCTAAAALLLQRRLRRNIISG